LAERPPGIEGAEVGFGEFLSEVIEVFFSGQAHQFRNIVSSQVAERRQILPRFTPSFTGWSQGQQALDRPGIGAWQGCFFHRCTFLPEEFRRNPRQPLMQGAYAGGIIRVDGFQFT
jgi:hypothetical protein